MKIEKIKTEYHVLEPRAGRLLDALMKEIGELLHGSQVALGVPLEGRVKTWESIQEKLERKSLEPETASDLDDLVGVRVILLFRSDLRTVIDMLKKTFDVLSVEDTSDRLGESQFGYQSQHLVLRLPSAWSEIPSLSDLCNLKAEIQVRTVAQHIWAAASHKLQYKQEEYVPPPLRRTIYRISALLETVDLELDRVLDERRAYTYRDANETPTDETLNVDLLATILDASFPPQNKASDEDYGDLLGDLLHFNIRTADSLRHLLNKQIKHLDSEEKRRLKEVSASPYDYPETLRNRVKEGIFLNHSGLLRTALRKEFGDDALNTLWRSKRAARQGLVK